MKKKKYEKCIHKFHSCDLKFRQIDFLTHDLFHWFHYYFFFQRKTYKKKCLISAKVYIRDNWLHTKNCNIGRKTTQKNEFIDSQKKSFYRGCNGISFIHINFIHHSEIVRTYVSLSNHFRSFTMLHCILTFRYVRHVFCYQHYVLVNGSCFRFIHASAQRWELSTDNKIINHHQKE